MPAAIGRVGKRERRVDLATWARSQARTSGRWAARRRWGFPNRIHRARTYDRVVAVLRVPGGELYCAANGEGVGVVLVHGLALDARMWDDQVPALTDIARVVRYDVRGFGRSARDPDTVYSHASDLWRLLDHLGIDTAVLVGLSMGGRIVVEATLAAPERVQALVLLDAVLDGVPWDPESERGMQAIGEGLRSGGLAGAKAAWAASRLLRARTTHAGHRAPARRDGRRLLRGELDERGPARTAPT